MNLKTNDIVLCTVRKIEGANVFVDIEDNGQGSIVLSEIAAGRIRNLREYVAIKKRIVCKVLKVYPDHAELSLRRVTAKEKSSKLEEYQKENTFASMLKTLTPDYKSVLDKIKESSSVSDFFDEAKENPSILSEFLKKEEANKLSRMISEKNTKEKSIKKIFLIKSTAPDGVIKIKDILSNKEVEIRYLGSSNFSISASAKDFKEAEKKISNVLKTIEEKSKEKKLVFELKEK